MSEPYCNHDMEAVRDCGLCECDVDVRHLARDELIAASLSHEAHVMVAGMYTGAYPRNYIRVRCDGCNWERDLYWDSYRKSVRVNEVRRDWLRHMEVVTAATADVLLAGRIHRKRVTQNVLVVPRSHPDAERMAGRSTRSGKWWLDRGLNGHYCWAVVSVTQNGSSVVSAHPTRKRAIDGARSRLQRAAAAGHQVEFADSLPTDPIKVQAIVDTAHALTELLKRSSTTLRLRDEEALEVMAQEVDDVLRLVPLLEEQRNKLVRRREHLLTKGIVV